jgi:Fic-DOC domain mobile mystery protein B
MNDQENPDGATLLDPDEMMGLKFPHIQTRIELDQMEQVNIQDGLRWLSHQNNINVLNDSFLRELHRRLLGEVWSWAGKFRLTEKNIGVAPEQIAVLLRNLLDDVQYWIEHKTYCKQEIALRFHHKLVQIHLFPNGNGRHARIATDALLKTIGEQEINWGNSSLKSDSKHRQAYIEALREADKGNHLPLLDKFTRD